MWSFSLCRPQPLASVSRYSRANNKVISFQAWLAAATLLGAPAKAQVLQRKPKTILGARFYSGALGGENCGGVTSIAGVLVGIVAIGISAWLAK
jgi:hypothetical protein